MDKAAVLAELVRMSTSLGQPDKDYAILGEGNTSARIDDDTFYVKESGAYLATAAAEQFVEVRASAVLDMLEVEHLTDEEIKDRLTAARVSPSSGHPSIETVFHAYLLTIPGVNFVGHTHPVAVNTLLCSNEAREIIKSRVFPDEIIFCGIRPIFLPYMDPGVELARQIREGVIEFTQAERVRPKAILMQNHGLIALGSTSGEVEAITAMWVKTARVLAGAYALGGIHYLTTENVNRIYTRPDEEYRVRQFKAGSDE